MNIYIDKPNLLSIVRSVKNEQYDDCKNMLKKHFKILFTFEKERIMEFTPIDRQEVMLWLSQMTTGIGLDNVDNVKWGESFLQRPLDISNYKDCKLSSVYCLSPKFNSQKKEDTKLESEIKKGNLLIACQGEEISLLSTLYFEDLQFTRHIFFEISSWNDLVKYTSPCTDIIITDPYIFSSPELYQYNIYTLIKLLSRTVKNSKLNIVIFTLKSYYDKITKVNYVPDWDDIYRKIRKCAEKHTSFNVTFVTASKDTLDEHDRTIFTNYKLFTSGDTYNYFNSNGDKLTKGRNFYVHSNVTKSNVDISKKFIEDMQRIIDNIKSKGNDSLIKKDKISNYLKF